MYLFYVYGLSFSGGICLNKWVSTEFYIKINTLPNSAKNYVYLREDDYFRFIKKHENMS